MGDLVSAIRQPFGLLLASGLFLLTAAVIGDQFKFLGVEVGNKIPRHSRWLAGTLGAVLFASGLWGSLDLRWPVPDRSVLIATPGGTFAAANVPTAFPTPHPQQSTDTPILQPPLAAPRV